MKRLLLCLLFPAALAFAKPGLVYVGTYTEAGSRGIYAFRFDPADGSCTEPFLAGKAADPSFITFGPGEHFLYAIDEKGGSVGAYAVDAAAGHLTRLNRRPTEGTGTAHLAVDPGGRMLIVANYGSGTVVSYPIEPDGGIGPRVDLIPQKGVRGPYPVRQTQSHPHSVTLSPDARFAFVCDLGWDRIFVYRLDPERAGLVPNEPPYATVPPGSGPRHSVFSPDARFFYVVSEMGGTVSTFAYDAAAGSLTRLQTVSTLPADAAGLNGSAEIRLHPNGRWIYASNRDVHGTGRGSDSLAGFARDPQSGLLRRVQIIPCGGRSPRNFTLSPDGRWLLCGNQESDTITVFRVDPESGRLTATGGRIKVSKPVCVLFAD